MTHEDLIQRLAQQLDWSDGTTTEALDAMISVLKAELTANNPVDLDDFGKFSTPKQPEYILTDREANERYLMPPAVEVLFESSDDLFFIPEDSLNESVNSAFSHFEPTLIHEGVEFPGVEEVIAGEDEEMEEEAEKAAEETTGTEKEAENTEEEATGSGVAETEPEITETAKENETIIGEMIREVKTYRDYGPHRKKTKQKKLSPLWIPIAGGVAIALAALFFFRVWQPGKNESTGASQQWQEAEVKTNAPLQVLKADTSLPEAKKVRLADGKTLRLLAQDLFGDREFWVYIYLENKSRIINPNRVPAGTELVVPDRIKYGINAADPVSVATAKNQGNKILGAPLN